MYKKDIDNLKTRNTTLQTLVQAILNYEDDEVFDLVRQMRTAESLEDVADSITARAKRMDGIDEGAESHDDIESVSSDMPQFESELAGRMSELRLDGSGKFIGGTSNLIFLPPGCGLDGSAFDEPCPGEGETELGQQQSSDDPITCWTTVTENNELIRHLLTMYFTWHYAYFTTLSKELFYRDFVRGRSTQYCSPLLVNAMLALGCHFSSWPASRANPEDSATAGNHFFKEAKRLILENDEHEKAKLCTVQALALMSVREAGCGREGKGWVYSGMSFRMAHDLGLNVDAAELTNSISEEDVDARRITFWGCFLFDKWVKIFCFVGLLKANVLQGAGRIILAVNHSFRRPISVCPNLKSFQQRMPRPGLRMLTPASSRSIPSHLGPEPFLCKIPSCVR